MFRIFSNEGTKLAYDGTPEAPHADVVRDQKDRMGFVHRDVPGQGLPDGHPAGMRSVLSPGMNEVSDNEYALLSRDVNFQNHLKAGVLAFVDDEGRAIDPPPAPEYKPEPATNPAARHIVNQGAETLPEERTDAYAEETGDRRNTETGKGAKLKTGEKVVDANNATAKEVEDYFGLNAEERAAMYPALTPEGKAAVDADKRSDATAVATEGNATPTTPPVRSAPPPARGR